MGSPEKIPPISNPASFVFAGWIFAIVVLVGGVFGGVALWRRAKSASEEVRARVVEIVKSKPHVVAPKPEPPVVPSAAEPPKPVEPAPAPGAQAKTPEMEIIQRIVRRHIEEVKFCYQAELRRHPKLAGRLTVRFTIGSKGQVLSSERLSSTLQNAKVESCVLKATRRWSFPPPAGGEAVRVVYPFVFSS